MATNVESIEFRVQGSQDEPYSVTCYKLHNRIKVTCTCKAGEFGKFCKHRLAILSGDIRAIVSSNVDGIAEVEKWLGPTGLLTTLRELAELEATKKAITTRIGKLKKEIIQHII